MWFLTEVLILWDSFCRVCLLWWWWFECVCVCVPDKDDDEDGWAGVRAASACGRVLGNWRVVVWDLWLLPRAQRVYGASVNPHGTFILFAVKKWQCFSVCVCVLQAAAGSGAAPALPVKPPKLTVSVSVSLCWTSAAASVPSPWRWECPCVTATTSEWVRPSSNLFYSITDEKNIRRYIYLVCMCVCVRLGFSVQRLLVLQCVSSLRLVSDVQRDEEEETSNCAWWPHP